MSCVCKRVMSILSAGAIFSARKLHTLTSLLNRLRLLRWGELTVWCWQTMPSCHSQMHVDVCVCLCVWASHRSHYVNPYIAILGALLFLDADWRCVSSSGCGKWVKPQQKCVDVDELHTYQKGSLYLLTSWHSFYKDICSICWCAGVNFKPKLTDIWKVHFDCVANKKVKK